MSQLLLNTPIPRVCLSKLAPLVADALSLLRLPAGSAQGCMTIATCTGLSGPRSWQQPSLRDCTVAPPCCCCLLPRAQRSHQPQALQTESFRQRTVSQQTPGINTLYNTITYLSNLETVEQQLGAVPAAPNFWRHRLIGHSELAQKAVLRLLVRCLRDRSNYGYIT